MYHENSSRNSEDVNSEIDRKDEFMKRFSYESELGYSLSLICKLSGPIEYMRRWAGLHEIVWDDVTPELIPDKYEFLFAIYVISRAWKIAFTVHAVCFSIYTSHSDWSVG